MEIISTIRIYFSEMSIGLINMAALYISLNHMLC